MGLKKIKKFFRRKETGSMGIGAMIIFIAMVLVAGIAASVLIQVANTLQMQALYTGQETIEEVATGISVVDVEGHVSDPNIGIDLITISVKGRSGSREIDLNQTKIELADNDTKVILRYNSSQHSSAPAATGVFDTSSFSLNANEFGVIVLEDADGSLTTNTALPIINRGDLVMFTVNTSMTFSPGLLERTSVWGNVIPEIGSWGIITFRTPSAFVNEVYNLL